MHAPLCLFGVVWRWTAIAAGFALLAPADARAETTPRWLTGAGLQKQLAQPVGVQWSGTPLREAVVHLAHNYEVAVLIDRRVDPGQPLEVALDDVPLRQAFDEIAANQNLGVTLVGPVVYWGPIEVASKLRTLSELRREEAVRLPAEQAQRLLRAERMAWPDFATPRDLLAGLAAEAGLSVSNPEAVPHDLWAAADLPPLSLVERLTLVLVQFGLTYQTAADGRSITLVPAPQDVALVRSYPAGTQGEQLAARWASLAPGCQIKVVKDKIWVRGLLEDHERLAAWRSAPAGPTPGTPPLHAPGQGEKRYTVRQAQGPLAKVLEQLAAQLQLKVEYDLEGLQRAGISLDQQVTFSVNQATLDELLEAVLKPAGCSFRRRGSTVEVFAAGSGSRKAVPGGSDPPARSPFAE